MSSFNCPKCKANVQKSEKDPPGCTCCGFGMKQASFDGNTAKCSHCHENAGSCKGHVLLS